MSLEMAMENNCHGEFPLTNSTFIQKMKVSRKLYGK